MLRDRLPFMPELELGGALCASHDELGKVVYPFYHRHA